MFEHVTKELKKEVEDGLDYHFPKQREDILDHKTRSFADGNKNKKFRQVYFLVTGNDRSPEKGYCNCLSTYINIAKDLIHIYKNYLKNL